MFWEHYCDETGVPLRGCRFELLRRSSLLKSSRAIVSRQNKHTFIKTSHLQGEASQSSPRRRLSRAELCAICLTYQKPRLENILGKFWNGSSRWHRVKFFPADHILQRTISIVHQLIPDVQLASITNALLLSMTCYSLRYLIPIRDDLLRFPPLPIAFLVVVASFYKCLMYLAKASLGNPLDILILWLSKPLPLNLKVQVRAFLLGLKARSCALLIRRGEGRGLLNAPKSPPSLNNMLHYSFRSIVDSTLSSLVGLTEKLIPAYTRLVYSRQYFFIWILLSRYLRASLNTPRNS